VNRIAVETRYLSAKDALLASTKGRDRLYMLDTIALAEDRLGTLKETKALLDEKMEFMNARISGNDEFDKLLRLRRNEVFLQSLYSKTPITCTPVEAAWGMLSALFLAVLFFLRKRFFFFIKNSPLVSHKGLYVGLGYSLFFGGLLFFAFYGGFNLFGFRFAAQTLGLLYLNVGAGLIVFLILALLMETYSVLVIQKITRANPAEIKEASAVYSLINTGFKFFLLIALASQILFYWTIRREITEILSYILNYPVFRASNVEVSIRLLFRSMIVVWIFCWLPRFTHGFLKKYVYPKTSLDRNSQHAIKSVIRFVLITAGLLIGIELLGIDLSSLAIFSGTLGLGIGLGLQDIIKNIVSGFVIYFERPIRIGDIVEVGNVPGQVKSIRTRSTVINTYDNISIVVPNSDFLNQRVVNWSLSDRSVRIEVKVGVAYGSDVQVVKETLLEITKNIKKINDEPEPIIVFEEFADSALIFRILFWVNLEDRLEVKSAVNFSIHSRFKEKGIIIPFPQRDVHLKSSDLDLLKKI